MPAIRIYTDSDEFEGANLADLATHATAAGNAWINTNDSAGKIVLDGAGRAKYAAGSPSIASIALYKVSLTDPALPVLTFDEYGQMLVTIVIFGVPGTEVRWMTALVPSVDGGLSGVAFGAMSLNFVQSNLQQAVRVTLTNGEYVPTGIAQHATLRLGSVETTITARIDPYQMSFDYSTFSGGFKLLDFPAAPNRVTTRLVPALLLFSDPVGEAGVKLVRVAFDYYRYEAMQIHRQWSNWGKTAVLDTGLLAFTDAFVALPGTAGEPVANLGGFDVIVPRYAQDRGLSVYMAIVDNRLNPGVVDVLIGPSRWRVAAFTEMELPLPKPFNTDIISLRGGGSRCRMRLFASEMEKSFRQ